MKSLEILPSRRTGPATITSRGQSLTERSLTNRGPIPRRPETVDGGAAETFIVRRGGRKDTATSDRCPLFMPQAPIIRERSYRWTGSLPFQKTQLCSLSAFLLDFFPPPPPLFPCGALAGCEDLFGLE